MQKDEFLHILGYNQLEVSKCSSAVLTRSEIKKSEQNLKEEIKRLLTVFLLSSTFQALQFYIF